MLPSVNTQEINEKVCLQSLMAKYQMMIMSSVKIIVHAMTTKIKGDQVEYRLSNTGFGITMPGQTSGDRPSHQVITQR